MAEWFASGRAIDVILVVMVIEAAALIAYRMTRQRGPGIPETIANLASGAMIMLAVRSALTDGVWQMTALFLMGAFAAHLADLAIRLRNS